MSLSQVGELALLEKIRTEFTKKPEPRTRGSRTRRAVVTGIGDDAAVLRPRGWKNLLVSTDMMLEGVHFDLRLITPFQLGFKLVSVNVSDIYAMGGKPGFALLGIAAAGDTEEAFLDRFFEGVRAGLELYKLSLVGGDVSSSRGHMALSVTLLGYADKPLRRSGARPGDKIYVTGSLGQSACGLELLRKINRHVDFNRPFDMSLKRGRALLKRGRASRKEGPCPLKWAVMEPLLRRHLMPEARRPDRFLSYARAMIDISDGLFIDLTRLCTESNAGARLYKDSIPVSEETRAAAACLGLDPLELATSGGEDYELLFTRGAVRPSGRSSAGRNATRSSAGRNATRGAICIGEITKSGMVIVDEHGVEKQITPEGYQHFR